MSVEPTVTKKGKLNNGVGVAKNSHKWTDEHDAETIIDLNKVNSRRKLIRADKETNISGQDYNNRLRDFYSTRIQNTQFLSWAAKEVPQVKDQQQNLLQNRLMLNKDQINPLRFLQPGLINIKKVSYVKHQDKGDAVVQSIAFHTRLPVFVTGGFDKVLRVYQIKPDQTRGVDQIELLKTIFLEKFPISEVKFMNTSNIVIISSFQKKYLIAYDIKDNSKMRIQSSQVTADAQASGKRNCLIKFCIEANDNYIAIYSESGYIGILDGTTYLYKFGFKQNEACFSACFNDDYLFTSGQGGKIYQWSLDKKMIYNVISCPGAFQVNTLSVKNNVLAAGSQTGIVSLFRVNEITQKLSKEPIKEIQNLQTSITHVEFNQLGEYLCLVSKWKPNAFRILHTDSMTVFSNWPNMKTNLKFIHSLAISGDSRYLVFGNELGEVVVYQVCHY